MVIQQRKLTRIVSGATALVAVAGLATQVLLSSSAAAAQITNRSLTLEAGATDGGSKPGGTVKHLFTFTISNQTIGSIEFQYCTTAASVPGGTGCVAPGSGGGTNVPVDTHSAALGTMTGITNWNTVTPVQGADDAADTIYNAIIVSRAVAANASGAISVELTNIVNPGPAQTFFVRISTYASTNGSGSATDVGTVAAATSDQINLSGTMPESLVFCAGATVSTTGGVPDCSTITTGDVSFDRLFSPTDTATATSQMAASTNATLGYAITVNGPTLTSGANTIAAMSGAGGTATGSVHGLSQFGLNLVKNAAFCSTGCTLPNHDLGANVTTGTGNYNGTAATNYNTAATFKFASGDVVANSATLATDAQIFTVSYIVNVPGSQPAGTYTSTLTYICTPTF